MSNNKKKILVIHTSVGGGHKVVAESIAQELEKHPEFDVQLLDILKFYDGPFISRIGPAIYQRLLVNFPGIWRFFYTNKIFNKLTLPLRIPVAATRAKRLLQYLKEAQPDLILTTQSMATALVSYLKTKGRYSVPVVTTFSDYHFQPYWAYPGVDRYLVMTPEQVVDLNNVGVDTKQIVVTGLPISDIFLRQYDQVKIFEKFNLAKNKSLVLIMGGSLGLGISSADIAALLTKAQFDIQVVVVTGTNEKLRKRLKGLIAAHPGRLVALGQLPNLEIAELFSAAKVLVTKPGGLTVAQALVSGLPMVLVNPLPGSEELNREYLINRGVAVAADSPEELRSVVHTLLSDENFYQGVKNRSRGLGVADAARVAALATIDMLK